MRMCLFNVLRGLIAFWLDQITVFVYCTVSWPEVDYTQNTDLL